MKKPTRSSPYEDSPDPMRDLDIELDTQNDEIIDLEDIIEMPARPIDEDEDLDLDVEILDVDADLEPEPEIIRDLLRQALERSDGGEGIISGIDADRLENLRVLGQAIPFEPGLGKLPAPLITCPAIEQAAPARVFP